MHSEKVSGEGDLLSDSEIVKERRGNGDNVLHLAVLVAFVGDRQASPDERCRASVADICRSSAKGEVAPPRAFKDVPASRPAVAARPVLRSRQSPQVCDYGGVHRHTLAAQIALEFCTIREIARISVESQQPSTLIRLRDRGSFRKWFLGNGIGQRGQQQRNLSSARSDRLAASALRFDKRFRRWRRRTRSRWSSSASGAVDPATAAYAR